MEFFCYHRDRAGSMPLRMKLAERHWSYMDQFEAGMIARGPTFSDDETATGSVHILDLPDSAAARAFAFEEPNYQAGVYRDVMLRRWRNLLGRTMRGVAYSFSRIRRLPLKATAQLGPRHLVHRGCERGLWTDGSETLGVVVIFNTADGSSAMCCLTPACTCLI